MIRVGIGKKKSENVVERREMNRNNKKQTQGWAC